MTLPAHRWIDSAEALSDYLEQTADVPWLAVDTEFLRERTYHPQLCLLQLSDGRRHALVDAQAPLDFAPLLARLRDPDCALALHACLQDAEVLHHQHGLLLQNVFDTQVAWALLGRGYQSSYAQLVLELLGQTLDKSQTRSRWNRRPLSAAQTRYALLDVVHLGPVYEILHAELDRLGRLPWLREEMERLLAPSSWTPAPEDAWRAVARRLRDFPSQRLGALRALAAWRERAARKADVPRRRLLDDAPLADLARMENPDRAGFERILRRALRGAGLRAELWQALERAQEAASPVPPSRAERMRLRERTRALRPQLARVAQELGVAVELLAPRGMVEELLRGAERPQLLRGWRGRALADTVAAADVDAG